MEKMRIDLVLNEKDDKELIDWINSQPHKRATIARMALYEKLKMEKNNIFISQANEMLSSCTPVNGNIQQIQQLQQLQQLQQMQQMQQMIQNNNIVPDKENSKNTMKKNSKKSTKTINKVKAKAKEVESISDSMKGFFEE